jgi:hypothetical protein
MRSQRLQSEAVMPSKWLERTVGHGRRTVRACDWCAGRCAMAAVPGPTRSLGIT